MKKASFQFFISLLIVSLNGCGLIAIDSPGTPEIAATWKCGDDIEYGGINYKTVWIDAEGGNNLELRGQCWMAENLKFNKMPKVEPCCEGKGDGLNERFAYTWLEITASDGICPEGWHVSTDNDWLTLELALGMSNDQLFSEDVGSGNYGNRGKSDSDLNSLRTKLDALNFNLTYTGREIDMIENDSLCIRGSCHEAWFWTTTTEATGDKVIVRVIVHSRNKIKNGISRIARDKGEQICIRCVKN